MTAADTAMGPRSGRAVFGKGDMEISHPEFAGVVPAHMSQVLRSGFGTRSGTT